MSDSVMVPRTLALEIRRFLVAYGQAEFARRDLDALLSASPAAAPSGDVRSATPRTDAASFKQGGRYVGEDGKLLDPVIELVHADFARQLERDLAALRDELDDETICASNAERELTAARAALSSQQPSEEALAAAQRLLDGSNDGKSSTDHLRCARELLRLAGKGEE